jgi:signal recognition particle subunit SRP54
MLQGQFTFKDFYEQLSMIQRMGPLKEIIAKLPIQGMLPKDVNVDDRELVRIKAMIDSMTEEERVNPKVFNESRVRRVARGSGRAPKDVAELLKRFLAMRQMMGMMGKNLGLLGKIPGLGQMAQLGKMAKMGREMGGGMGGMGMPGMGGMPPGMGDLAGMLGGAGGNAGLRSRPIDRDKQRKLRKDAKKARKKNRKK